MVVEAVEDDRPVATTMVMAVAVTAVAVTVTVVAVLVVVVLGELLLLFSWYY